MKVKTSITLSKDLLLGIEQHLGSHKSRSEFIEQATKNYIAYLDRKLAEQRDIAIINKHAESLNAEAEDVLKFQIL